jgi:peroxiredoxin
MDAIIPIGAQAPEFELPDLKGSRHDLQDFRGGIQVLNFWSAECTWCERVDREITAFLNQWRDRVKVLWIASNANETRELIEKVAGARELPTVLLDERQQVAKLYGVQTTPHFFVVDSKGKLAYQGAWDDITFRQRVAIHIYVPQVVEALLKNLSPEITQTPPYGCALVRFQE